MRLRGLGSSARGVPDARLSPYLPLVLRGAELRVPRLATTKRVSLGASPLAFSSFAVTNEVSSWAGYEVMRYFSYRVQAGRGSRGDVLLARWLLKGVGV